MKMKEKIISLIDNKIDYYMKNESNIPLNTLKDFNVGKNLGKIESLQINSNSLNVFEVGKILGKIEALQALKYEIDNIKEV